MSSCFVFIYTVQQHNYCHYNQCNDNNYDYYHSNYDKICTRLINNPNWIFYLNAVSKYFHFSTFRLTSHIHMLKRHWLSIQLFKCMKGDGWKMMEGWGWGWACWKYTECLQRLWHMCWGTNSGRRNRQASVLLCVQNENGMQSTAFHWHSAALFLWFF